MAEIAQAITADTSQQTICQFYQLIPGAPAPKRADRSALGTMTVDAYRYCETMRAASGFGWHVCPPMDFRLLLDDDEVFWNFDDSGDYYPISGGVQFPDFTKTFASIAPDELKELPPPFIAQGSLPGLVQIWSGYLAQTLRGWSLYLRGIVNYQKPQSFKVLEGIVESSKFAIPLFLNVRLTRTNVPLRFSRSEPFLQVLPLRQECYLQPDYAVLGPEDMTPEIWDQFGATLKRGSNFTRNPGHYAVAVRKDYSAAAE